MELPVHANHLYILSSFSFLERIRMSQTAAPSLDGRHSNNSLAGLLFYLQQGSCKDSPSHRIMSRHVTLRPFPFIQIKGVYQRSERGRVVGCQNPSLAEKAFCIIMLRTNFCNKREKEKKKKTKQKKFLLIGCHFLIASPLKPCEMDS